MANIETFTESIVIGPRKRAAALEAEGDAITMAEPFMDEDGNVIVSEPKPKASRKKGG